MSRRLCDEITFRARELLGGQPGMDYEFILFRLSNCVALYMQVLNFAGMINCFFALCRNYLFSSVV